MHPAGRRPARGSRDGDSVEVASRRGRAVLPAVVTDRVRPGSCFAPFHWNDLFGEYLSVNAVTNDAVDPVSFQPEFKVCAVSLTKVPTPVTVRTPRGRGDRPERSRAGRRARDGRPRDLPAGAPIAFGARPAPPPVAHRAGTPVPGRLPRGHRRRGAPGVPVLPPDAPFAPSTPCGSTACSPGCTRGRAGRSPRRPPSTSAVPAAPGGRRPVGLADRQRRGVRRRHRRAAHRGRPQHASLVGMDDADPGTLPPGADLLLITSTFGDGDAPDNGAGFWEALADARHSPPGRAAGTPSWPSATPRTTTSAATAGGSTSASTSWARSGWPRARTASRTTRTRRTAGWTRS